MLPGLQQKGRLRLREYIFNKRGTKRGTDFKSVPLLVQGVFFNLQLTLMDRQGSEARKLKEKPLRIFSRLY